MSQHDYNVANQALNVARTDVNNALASILSNNSGSSAPTTTDAYMGWADTSNSVFKHRNSADNDWITTFKLDGVQQYASGSTAALPAFSKADDVNTGIYFPAADEIAISVGGAEAVRVDSDGNVGIGTSSPNDKLDLNLGNVAGNYIRFGGTNRNNNGLNKLLKFHHGYWGGAQEVASIGVLTTSSTGGSGTGNGDLVFYTGSSGDGDAGSTSAERMRIDSAGNVGIGMSDPIFPIQVKGSVQTGVASTIASLVIPDTTGNRGGYSIHNDSGGLIGGIVGEIVTGGTYPTSVGKIDIFVQNGGGTTKVITANSSGKVYMPSLGTSGTSAASISITSSGELFEDTSSLQFKEKVENIKIDTSKLFDIKPRTYIRKSSGLEEVGLIAEELVELLPEFVGFKNDVPYSVNYQKLVVPIIAELKKLRDRISNIEKK